MGYDDISTILADAPDNWGTWGEDDELGAVNHLTESEVLRGVRAVERGTTFTLGLPIGGDGGDPVWPSRDETGHYMLRDKGHVESGKVSREPFGNWENSDDVLHMFNHGTTHVDALGHAWYGDSLYNGFDANSTKGGLDRCGVEHVADHGVVGRGVLLDVARHRDVSHLGHGERITLEELRECADAQGVDLEERDVLLVRTGAMGLFYREGREAFYEEYRVVDDGDEVLDEPGVTYTRALTEWFHDMEIPFFGTDTVTAEQTLSEETGTRNPLHAAFLRDLGIAIGEMNDLEELADDCAEDGSYDFLFVASPLNVVGGTGAPTNPVAIK